MAERGMKVGQRVELTGKDVRGEIVYIGNTHFASGKWIGVVLDSPKGKNNGSVQGKQYFQCEENHGIFMRPSQLTLLDDQGQPIEMKASQASFPGVGSPPLRSSVRKRTEPNRLPVSASRRSSQPDVAELQVTPLKEAAQVAETSSKRASFVETGFLETLKPQYIPGTFGAGFSNEDRLTHAQQAMEIEKLNNEIKGLNEKIQTLIVKRSQDRERLKENDKLRLQNEQLLEFKSRILEAQTVLQRELSKAKMDAREAIEAKERHADEMCDLSETVEMATLDKEMAEEKAEALQIELDQANDRIEALTMDVELLRAEIKERGEWVAGLGGDVNSQSTEEDTNRSREGEGRKMPSVFLLEIKQLEQQNSKLKETLVRLRDLSAHEKHESQKLAKELELRKSEVAELSCTKGKLSSRNEELERTIRDLQEQVDAALGSEEMVENLTNKNLTLEERVKELEDQLADLEDIADMNEQLQEGSRELELELREELDMANSAKREAIREKEAALETLVDRDRTIKKFRDLVQKLTDQSMELQNQLQVLSMKPLSTLPEMADFKKMFAESKAQTTAIDLEIRHIEVDQAKQHVQYITAYMPESFMSRGGDLDAMLLLLLVPRLIRKTKIVVEHVHVKFGSEPTYDPKSLLRDHVLDQFNFCCQFSFWIYSLQATLEKLQKILQTCSPANLLRMGTLYPDMAVQERAIDDLVERLRADKLDENASMHELQRCVTFFKTIEKEHLPTSVDHAAPASQLVATCRAFSAVLDGIFANAKSLTIFSKNRDASMDNMLEELEKLADSFRPRLKQCRRRVAMGASVNEANIVEFNEALKEGSSMMFVLIHFSQLCLQHIKTLSETQVKVLQLNTFVPTLTNCIHQVYGIENSSPVDLFKTNILKLLESVSNFSTTLQDIDFEVEAKPDEKIIAPIVIRAQAVKKELEQAKILREKLEAREADIKELKKCLKLKQEELSEMVIRKDLAESKLGNVHKDYAVNMEKLQRKLDDCQMLMRRKEKEFEETMDHLQADIDSLESERGELKEKYKSISKKVVTDILAKTTGPSGAASSMSGPSLAITVKDSPMLIQQVQDLRLALKHAQNELLRSRIHGATEKFNSLHSLKVGRKQQVSEKIRDSDGEFLGMSKQTVVLHKELQGVLSKPAVVEVSSKQPGKIPLLEKQAPCQHLSQNTVILHKLRNQAEVVQASILEQLLKGKAGSQAQSSFATFPNVAFAKALQEDTAKFVGRVALSKALERPQHAHTFPLMLDMAALRKLHYAIPV